MAPGKKGKAGGPGKKGKKFVEDKSALLSMIDAIPRVQKESADEIVASEALSAKGKSRSAAEQDEQVAVASTGIDSREVGHTNTDSEAQDEDRSRRAKAEPKKESKNRQRTKAKNRALLDTKRAILAKTKEVKKQRKDAKKPASQGFANDAGPRPDVKPKRRVGFAL